MRRGVLLAVLALALPVAAFADSVTDYATFGTTSAELLSIERASDILPRSSCVTSGLDSC